MSFFARLLAARLDGAAARVTTAVDRYLLHGTLPRTGTLCHSPVQLFTGRSPEFLVGIGALARTAQTDAKQLPPVTGRHANSTLSVRSGNHES